MCEIFNYLFKSLNDLLIFLIELGTNILDSVIFLKII
jgi:hypothetical protein